MQGLVREDWTPYRVLVEGMRRANRAVFETFQQTTGASNNLPYL
jgi:hypothetical protein